MNRKVHQLWRRDVFETNDWLDGLSTKRSLCWPSDLDIIRETEQVSILLSHESATYDMGHTAQRSSVAVLSGTKMAHRNHTSKRLDLRQVSTTTKPKQRRRSQPYHPKILSWKDDSSAHRNHAQNQTKPRSRPARLSPFQMPGSSVESLHEVFRFKDEALGQSPKREAPQRGLKNSHPRGLFRANLHPSKSPPRGPYKPQWCCIQRRNVGVVREPHRPKVLGKRRRSCWYARRSFHGKCRARDDMTWHPSKRNIIMHWFECWYHITARRSPSIFQLQQTGPCRHVEAASKVTSFNALWVA